MTCRHSIECTDVRVFKKFLLALMDTGSKNLDQRNLTQIICAQLLRKAAAARNTPLTSSGETDAHGIGHGRKPRDLVDPASMNPEQLTPTPTKQDLLNEEIQKLAMRSHLEVEQRENIRRDFAERMKYLRARENVFFWQEDPIKIQQGRKSGKWSKVEIIAVKALHDSYQHRCDHIFRQT